MSVRSKVSPSWSRTARTAASRSKLRGRRGGVRRRAGAGGEWIRRRQAEDPGSRQDQLCGERRLGPFVELARTRSTVS